MRKWWIILPATDVLSMTASAATICRRPPVVKLVGKSAVKLMHAYSVRLVGMV